jgi:EcsC protein family
LNAGDLGRPPRIQSSMAKRSQKPWLRQVLTNSAQAGFRRAYEQVRIDESKYLRHVQRAHQLPIQAWREMFYLGPEVIDPIAARTISAASKMAALEGMGLGLGGFLTAIPDMGILAAITLRMLQKLSLLYGFEYATEDETVALWIAVASAAGVDLGRDFLEKQAVERVVPKLVDQVAVKVGAEVAEKWAGRIVPVVSAGVAGAINYYFVRAWGRRAQKHFLERHCAVLARSAQARMRASAAPALMAAPEI